MTFNHNADCTCPHCNLHIHSIAKRVLAYAAIGDAPTMYTHVGVAKGRITHACPVPFRQEDRHSNEKA